MLDAVKNVGDEFPYIGNTNVHWFDIRLDNLKRIKLSLEEKDKYILAKGDVLICEGGHGIGRTAVWDKHHQNIAFQKALHRVRTGPLLNSHFFSYCMFCYFFSGVLQKQFTGVGIPHFTGRALASLIFPQPPLAEQRRIVAKVNELMTLCDQIEASLTAGETRRSGLLTAILGEALSPAEERDEAA